MFCASGLRSTCSWGGHFRGMWPNPGQMPEIRRVLGCVAVKKLLFVILFLAILGGGAFGGWYFLLKDNPDFSLASMKSKVGMSEADEATAYRAAFDKALSDADLRVYAVVKKEFPDEYQAMLDNLKNYETAFILGYYDGERYQQFGASSIGNSAAIQAGYTEGYQTGVTNAKEYLSTMPDIDPVEYRAGAEVTLLRRAYANAAFNAPDKDLRVVIDMSLALHKRVLAEEGAETCNQFAYGGPIVLADKFDNYVEDLDLQTASMLKALANGKKATEKRTMPSGDDFEIMVQTMRANGISDEKINIIMSQDFKNEAFCPALISLIETLQNMESDAGIRLRANYVRTLAAG
jgi:hypothetical protein